MKRFTTRIVFVLAMMLCSVSIAGEEKSEAEISPAPLDLKKAEAEIRTLYAKAHPEIQEYILYTARQFGPSGLWLNEEALAGLPEEARDKKVQYLATLLEEGEYGRHLCKGLAEASSLADKRLVPGLMKVAGYHREDRDYDCRAKWMAVAALARQESDDAVPLLIIKTLAFGRVRLCRERQDKILSKTNRPGPCGGRHTDIIRSTLNHRNRDNRSQRSDCSDPTL